MCREAFPAEKYAPIYLFSDVFVPLDKISCTSAMKRKVCFSHFSFALRPVCIIFASNFDLIMKARLFAAALAVCAALLTTGCGGNDMEKKAEGLLEQARTEFNAGAYAKALATIDTLRKNCPEAIEARKQALKLYQEVELKRAQLVVSNVDTVLQRVDREYQEMKKTVDALREKSAATEEQLRTVNLMRVKRDSLQTVFDVECAKIKYIKKKMEEEK